MQQLSVALWLQLLLLLLLLPVSITGFGVCAC
jgi:hypothetical protein